MATMVPGKAQRQNIDGNKVERLTATLPQTGNQTLFTITTGRVLITSMLGEVTTAIQAQANATIIRALGTLGSTSTALHAAWDVNGLAVGTLIEIPGVLGSNVVTGGSVGQGNEFILPIGTVQMNTAASSTGSIRWTVTYRVVDDGAQLVAS